VRRSPTACIFKSGQGSSDGQRFSEQLVRSRRAIEVLAIYIGVLGVDCFYCKTMLDEAVGSEKNER
jgi:hypothetical protein